MNLDDIEDMKIENHLTEASSSEGISEEIDFDADDNGLEFSHEASTSDSPTQVTVEETLSVQFKRIPKESTLAHFKNIYENLQTKLCHLIDEGEFSLDDTTTLTLVLDMRASLKFCEGKRFSSSHLPSFRRRCY